MSRHDGMERRKFGYPEYRVETLKMGHSDYRVATVSISGGGDTKALPGPALF